MGDTKRFEKYKLYGAYHWEWYELRMTYKRHAQFLKSWVQEPNTIDIGAGDGFITNFLGIRGVDNDPHGIAAAASKGVHIDLGDAYALPYTDEEFESALMSDVIEHFSDIGPPLLEARRIISKYLYVTIPTSESFNEPDHYHAWTPDEFIESVVKYGYKLVEGPRVKYHKRRYYFKFQKI